MQNSPNQSKSSRSSKGQVYLVGAGLGGATYLTLRGKELLESAEVLVYDALVDGELLRLVPSGCLKVDVGKRGGKPSTPQAEIDRLLVDYCCQGKRVVRLKSGDPLIFGRARSEVTALSAAGCDFELVPGISSVLAAPLMAGIPLTDKELSGAFAVVSGHQPDRLDWEALSRIDTLVVLMGGRNLGTIQERLQRYGRSRDRAIAIIRDGGRSTQSVWQGTLADILDRTAGVSLSPCVIVIGEVVRLQSVFQSMTHSSPLPLQGKTVLVTRAVEQSSTFAELLQERGATVVEMPALEIRPPSSWEALDRAIARLSDFNWLILTSSNGVDFFFERLAALGKDARSLVGVKIAVVGRKTAASLQQRNLIPDFIPPDFVADSLVEHFPESLQGKQILFPRVETGGREVLVKELTTRGATVTEVPAYQSACPDAIDPATLQAFKNQTIDIVTFASSKTAKNAYHLLVEALGKEFLCNTLERVCIASIGPQTTKTCNDLFGRTDIEAQEYTLEGLTHAIAR
ncbi:uroporphyrinogen-III C-methyltransferase [Lusitaniella coriacea LEGE 07157]|uniref:uroporphyrinogen-III C-methyltransferase n=1 Tax=Lusitaniella coriacea LEGE 07157 TaxID=945747 RepID=A0A8J7IY50_9CYAN|nr:uroporphyrinogen-III C-methyltransferase [Lusitaniella coriacea]MBE9119207.1 uroporphyrinogen-III C-methyltransferase [Lusitaniella coriacea LEGE 07157]